MRLIKRDKAAIRMLIASRDYDFNCYTRIAFDLLDEENPERLERFKQIGRRYRRMRDNGTMQRWIENRRTWLEDRLITNDIREMLQRIAGEPE